MRNPRSAQWTMKRKLNQHDVPEETGDAAAAPPSSNSKGFDSLGLDERLLQGIARQKFAHPTPIQLEAIPLALQGKDILGRYSSLW
jgi:ATP-dependent RNA helicase DDX56/DBP9